MTETNLVVLACVTARIVGLLLALPLDTSLKGGRMIFVATCFSLPLSISYQGDASFSALLLLKDLGIGFLIGAPVRILVEGAEMLGEIIDTGRGQTIGSVMDPLNGQQGSELSKVCRLGTFILIVQCGGIERLLDSIIASFSVLPTVAVPISIEAGRHALQTGSYLISALLSFAGIWLGCFLMTDTALAVLAKASQGLSFSTTSSWLKFLVAFILLINLATSPQEILSIVGSTIARSSELAQLMEGN